MNLKVTSIMQNALSSMTDGAFQGAASALSESKENVREQMQKKTFPKMEAVLKKLSENEQVSPDEMSLIQRWIVGDAESYVQEEDNFNARIEEYKILVGALARYENTETTEESFIELSGLLEDALRISVDIANFLEKKDRIKNFQLAASDGIDKEGRDTLIRILKGKLLSQEY